MIVAVSCRRSLLGCCVVLAIATGCGEGATPRDAYDEPGHPNDAGLTAANFPSDLDDASSCRDYVGADLHDRTNFLRARKNLTKDGARKVDEFLAALCEAAIDSGGGDGGNAADTVPSAVRAAIDSGALD